MVTQVRSDNRAGLESQGFTISSWKGFDDTQVALITHKPLQDKQPGDVAIRMRVGDPKNMNNGEATYLQRKASQGFFPWPPGEECLKRTFQNVSITRDAFGRATTSRTDPVKGCPWCRKAADIASGEELDQPPPASPRRTAPVCDDCGWEPDAGMKKPNQALAMHRRHRHQGGKKQDDGSASGGIPEAPKRQSALAEHMKRFERAGTPEGEKE